MRTARPAPAGGCGGSGGLVRLAWLCVVLIPTAGAAGLSGQVRGDAPQRTLSFAPLSLEAVATLRGHNSRSPINFSPDGAWIAHTVRGHERVARSGLRYTATGIPLAEGDGRMEATLSSVADTVAIRLGDPGSASWAPVWSPDGERVAFYSDAGGEAGLWIWQRATGRARRVGTFVARPFFGFETPRWTPDGSAVGVKILPEGTVLAEANALDVRPSIAPRTPTAPEAESAPVRVLRSGAPPQMSGEPEDEPGHERTGEPGPVDPLERRPPVGDLRLFEVDLALVRLDGSVERLVRRRAIRDFAFSPDGKAVAYTVAKGVEPASEQANFDLAVVERETGRDRTLATNVRLRYGIEWSWSPDGRSVAWFPSGSLARRATAAGASDPLVVASVADGAVRSIGHTDRPSFDPGDGELRPLWTRSGDVIYALADGDLWEANLERGELRRAAGLDGWRLHTLISRPHSSVVWTTGEREPVHAVARSTSGEVSGILEIDPGTGRHRRIVVEAKSYGGVFSVDGSPASDRIAFASSSRESPGEIWTVAVRSRRLAQASRLNPSVQDIVLGEARVIGWIGPDGESSSASLLLPPDHRPGERRPAVVWIYGGSSGSSAVNRFGLVDASTFNMEVLATRGYAVIFPDAPMGVGSPIRDVLRSVNGAVDAAVRLGFVDADRLAIMGQSYGAYNVLGILTETTRFRAAVLTGAVIHPDLLVAYLDDPAYYEQGQGRMGGTPWEVPERYLENSPILRFHRIETPILIGQGEKDGDLGPAEAIFTALDRLEKPVELRIYPGEGHVLTRRWNVIDFWERRLDFLSEALGADVAPGGRKTPG